MCAVCIAVLRKARPRRARGPPRPRDAREGSARTTRTRRIHENRASPARDHKIQKNIRHNTRSQINKKMALSDVSARIRKERVWGGLWDSEPAKRARLLVRPTHILTKIHIKSLFNPPPPGAQTSNVRPHSAHPPPSLSHVRRQHLRTSAICRLPATMPPRRRVLPSPSRYAFPPSS